MRVRQKSRWEYLIIEGYYFEPKERKQLEMYLLAVIDSVQQEIIDIKFRSSTIL